MEMSVRTTPAESALPFVLLDEQLLDLTRGAAGDLLLSFSSSVWESDLFLVLDIYSAAHPVHPEGHVGWWKYPLEDKRDLPLRVLKTDAGFTVSFEGRDDAECWKNPEFSGLAEDVLAVHVVLRHTVSEAIYFEDVLYLYNSAGALAASNARRADVEQVDGRAASLPWYVWPRMSKVHIVATNLYEHDAIGNFAISVARLLRAGGVPCQLYASRFDPALRDTIRNVADLVATVDEQDVLLVNFSIFDPFLPQMAALNCKKLVYFHNITPPRFFQIYDAEYAAHCLKGVAQAQLLTGFDGLLANSADSAAVLKGLLSDAKSKRMDSTEILEIGDSRTKGPFEDASRLLEKAARLLDRPSDPEMNVQVCPPLVNFEQRLQSPAEPVDLPNQKTLLVYVGRVAPHKKIEDLIALFQRYYKLNSDSALVIVGGSSFGGYSGYLRYLLLHEYAGIRHRIHFVDNVNDGQLRTIYERASALVTMSEHEGFCVPLVEAMAFDLPIFAFANDAVRQTLGRSGRVFYTKDFATIAADLHHVLNSPWKREQMAADQRRRLAEIIADADGRVLWAALEEVLFESASAAD